MRSDRVIILGLIGLFLGLNSNVLAQEKITLEQCYQLANDNYPLVKQRGLIEETADYNISNAAKGNLPQINFIAQASYQSDVPSLSIPGMQLGSLSKDQYRAYVEVNQNIYSGGVVKSQKQLAGLNQQIEDGNLAVEMYKLKERINGLFFGVLLLDGQLKQSRTLESELHLTLKKIEAGLKNGTAMKSQVNAIQVELLRLGQRIIEQQATRRAYTEMLSHFIQQSINEAVMFELPAQRPVVAQLNRKELRVFEAQQQLITAHQELVNNKNKPKLGLFLQSGIGRPSPVNFLSNSFSPYYIGGVRLTWNISGLYTASNDKKLLELKRSSISIQKELFEFNTAIILKQQWAAFQQMQAVMESDDEIIRLRNDLKKNTAVLLENGGATTNDYIKDVLMEDESINSKQIHQIQWLFSQYNLNTTSGN